MTSCGQEYPQAETAVVRCNLVTHFNLGTPVDSTASYNTASYCLMTASPGGLGNHGRTSCSMVEDVCYSREMTSVGVAWVLNNMRSMVGEGVKMKAPLLRQSW